MEDDFGVAFGAGIRALRESGGLTQDQLARGVSRTGMGVTWSRARMAQIESGDGIPDVGAMHAVALALSQLSGREVRLADLLPADGLSERLRLWREAVSGDPVRGPSAPVIGTVSDPRLDPGWGAVEDKVVELVGDLPEVVIRVARQLYGHSGTEERDQRAGEGSTPQKRGHASRAIIAELVAAVEADVEVMAEHDAALERGDS